MTSVQTYARTAGVLFLITLVAGGFGEFYAPSQIIVGGNAAATANNILAHNTLFRLGFAAYLVEALCDISIALAFYVLLKPVHRHIALLAAFFGILSTALFAVAELFYFSAPLWLGSADYLKAFSPEQLQAIAMLFVRVYGYGAGIFMTFYGIASVLRGCLIYRSGFLPKFLGALLIVAGLGFIVSNFLTVLAPHYASGLLLLPAPLAALALTLWLLFRGIDVAKWETRAAVAA